MSLSVHWFLPTAGDSRDIVASGDDGHHREPTLDYLAQIARAVDELGFHGVLTPTGTWCEDAWLTTAALIPLTRRLRFLVAFRPGFVNPVLAAQMAATYQRLSGGRLLLNVVTGGDELEMQRFGNRLSKDARYARAGEFLEILRGVWGEEPFDFSGEHYALRGATTRAAPDPRPEIYFGGASPAAEEIAAAHVDVYLAWGETPEMLAVRVERMRALAAERGRTLRFGVRLHVISRDRSEDAWAETDRLLGAMEPEAIASMQAALASSGSEGQRRMAALHGGRTDGLVIAPNLWAGIGLVRGGAGTALVGSHEEVADRIGELHDLGFDAFILSGHPHLEEAYTAGEGLLPVLRGRDLLADPPPQAAAPDPAARPRADGTGGAYSAPASETPPL